MLVSKKEKKHQDFTFVSLSLSDIDFRLIINRGVRDKVTCCVKFGFAFLLNIIFLFISIVILIKF